MTKKKMTKEDDEKKKMTIKEYNNVYQLIRKQRRGM
jgi:hypothetical protein